MPLTIAHGTFVGGRQQPLTEAMLWAIIDSAARSPEARDLRAIHADCCRLLKDAAVQSPATTAPATAVSGCGTLPGCRRFA